MQIRPATRGDLDQLSEIDGTIESTRYLHLEQSGEGFTRAWALVERALRQKLIDPNRLGDDTTFLLKQIVTGADEGVAMVAEHDGQLAGLLAAHRHPERGTMHVADLRIDYEQRREGIATAMIYRVIGEARQAGERAVSAQARTNNLPANQFLAKSGFDLSGVDTRMHTNHDVVKEAATLFWYATLH